jgi:hypothetical protein
MNVIESELSFEAGTPAQFALRFRPNAELVQVVRRFVSDFYEEILHDPDGVSRVALATHELLENAVKYSNGGHTHLTIEVLHQGEVSRVAIRISNRSTPENIEVVSSLFDEMRTIEDPFEHYQRAMRRSAKRVDGSGLGLVRVRAEGEMTMRHTVDGAEVSILAETTVARSAA